MSGVGCVGIVGIGRGVRRFKGGARQGSEASRRPEFLCVV